MHLYDSSIIIELDENDINVIIDDINAVVNANAGIHDYAIVARNCYYTGPYASFEEACDAYYKFEYLPEDAQIVRVTSDYYDVCGRL